MITLLELEGISVDLELLLFQVNLNSDQFSLHDLSGDHSDYLLFFHVEKFGKKVQREVLVVFDRSSEEDDKSCFSESSGENFFDLLELSKIFHEFYLADEGKSLFPVSSCQFSSSHDNRVFILLLLNYMERSGIISFDQFSERFAHDFLRVGVSCKLRNFNEHSSDVVSTFNEGNINLHMERHFPLDFFFFLLVSFFNSKLLFRSLSQHFSQSLVLCNFRKRLLGFFNKSKSKGS